MPPHTQERQGCLDNTSAFWKYFMQELGFCGKKGRPCRAGLDGLQRFPDLQSTRLFPPPQGLPPSSAPPSVCFVNGVPYPITSKTCLAPIVFFVLARGARAKVVSLGLRGGDNKRVSPLSPPQNVSYKTPCPYFKISAKSPLPWLP